MPTKSSRWMVSPVVGAGSRQCELPATAPRFWLSLCLAAGLRTSNRPQMLPVGFAHTERPLRWTRSCSTLSLESIITLRKSCHSPHDQMGGRDRLIREHASCKLYCPCPWRQLVDGSGWRAVYYIRTKDGFHVTIVQDPLTVLAGGARTYDATRRVIDQADGAGRACLPAMAVGDTESGRPPLRSAALVSETPWQPYKGVGHVQVIRRFAAPN